jgi:hypothetical protein
MKLTDEMVGTTGGKMNKTIDYRHVVKYKTKSKGEKKKYEKDKTGNAHFPHNTILPKAVYQSLQQAHRCLWHY